MAMAVSTPFFTSSTLLSSTKPQSCRETFTRHSFNEFVGLRLQSQFPGLFSNERSDLSSSIQKNVQGSGRYRLGQKMICHARFTMMPIGVPRVYYRPSGGRAYQLMDVWNALYRERIIFLYRWVDEGLSNQIMATMLYLDSVDYEKGLSLYINGRGGNVTPCMSIFDTMDHVRTPISTLCLGSAYNLSGLLLSAGEKGQRWTMPCARIELYPIAGSAQGRADEIQNETNELLRVMDGLFQKLALKTGQPLEKIKGDLQYRKTFSAKEAIEYGIVDHIVRPRKLMVDDSPDEEDDESPDEEDEVSDLD